MPETQLWFFRDHDGSVPVRDWLLQLRGRHKRAFAKCVVRLQRLAELGHELRRPDSDFVRDGVHELRAREGHVNYRILYFFHRRDVVVLAHALTKEDRLPNADIERAIARKVAFQANPIMHSAQEDIPNA